MATSCFERSKAADSFKESSPHLADVAAAFALLLPLAGENCWPGKINQVPTCGIALIQLSEASWDTAAWDAGGLLKGGVVGKNQLHFLARAACLEEVPPAADAAGGVVAAADGAADDDAAAAAAAEVACEVDPDGNDDADDGDAQMSCLPEE